LAMETRSSTPANNAAMQGPGVAGGRVFSMKTDQVHP
jgi:hypothetical protein